MNLYISELVFWLSLRKKNKKLLGLFFAPCRCAYNTRALSGGAFLQHSGDTVWRTWSHRWCAHYQVQSAVAFAWPGLDWKGVQRWGWWVPLFPNRNPSLVLLLDLIWKEISVWADASYVYNWLKHLLWRRYLLGRDSVLNDSWCPWVINTHLHFLLKASKNILIGKNGSEGCY